MMSTRSPITIQNLVANHLLILRCNLFLTLLLLRSIFTHLVGQIWNQSSIGRTTLTVGTQIISVCLVVLQIWIFVQNIVWLNVLFFTISITLSIRIQRWFLYFLRVRLSTILGISARERLLGTLITVYATRRPIGIRKGLFSTAVYSLRISIVLTQSATKYILLLLRGFLAHNFHILGVATILLTRRSLIMSPGTCAHPVVVHFKMFLGINEID